MKPLSQIIQHPRVSVIEADANEGGAFLVRRNSGKPLRVIASWQLDWDHVSVSLATKTPTYQDMKMVRRIFFKDDEWALEYHPPPKDYISVNDNVLHMWRPQSGTIPTPPKYMV